MGQFNAPVTLVPGCFTVNPFPLLDVSPLGRFVPGCLAPGRFAPWTFRLQISMVCVGVWGFNVERYVHYIIWLAASNH